MSVFPPRPIRVPLEKVIANRRGSKRYCQHAANCTTPVAPALFSGLLWLEGGGEGGRVEPARRAAGELFGMHMDEKCLGKCIFMERESESAGIPIDGLCLRLILIDCRG